MTKQVIGNIDRVKHEVLAEVVHGKVTYWILLRNDGTSELFMGTSYTYTAMLGIKVGDHVKLTINKTHTFGGPREGSVGIVRRFNGTFDNWGVEWIGFATGHNLDSTLGESSRGWYVNEQYLEVL